tara:strand:+ start:425 stop:2197 length:1773 start_codon:yes stop_codon:yes gene_type:complete
MNKPFGVIGRLWKHLSNRRKLQLLFLGILVLISGFAELFSLSAIIPLLSTISGSRELVIPSFVKEALSLISILDQGNPVIKFALFFSIVSFIASFLRLSNIWLNSQMSARIGTDLSTKAYRNILFQEYDFFSKRNSSELINVVTTHSSNTVIVINQFLYLATFIIVLIGLMLGLFIIDWKVAVCSGLFLFSSYIIIGGSAKKRILTNSRVIPNFVINQHNIVKEGLGTIKDLILKGNQNWYIRNYFEGDKAMRLKQAENQFLIQFPRYIIEPLILSLIGFFSAYVLISTKDPTIIIGLLGSFGLGAVKILPNVQSIYSSWGRIKDYSKFADDLCSILELYPIRASDINTIKKEELEFDNFLFDKISFSYDGYKDKVLDNISFSINKGQKIAIMGKSGSGKSTLVDLIMGLNFPSHGSIYVNDKQLYSSDKIDIKDFNFIAKWRRSIGHVPQDVYLVDSSIKQNIALGFDLKLVSDSEVINAAKLSFIHEFILSLPHGYNTNVGEMGSILSGGQRQRIGIARALFGNPKILVLDEATSALDSLTESNILDSILKIDKSLTIIYITHKKNLLDRFDKILLVDSGRLLNHENR